MHLCFLPFFFFCFAGEGRWISEFLIVHLYFRSSFFFILQAKGNGFLSFSIVNRFFLSYFFLWVLQANSNEWHDFCLLSLNVHLCVSFFSCFQANVNYGLIDFLIFFNGAYFSFFFCFQAKMNGLIHF